MTATASALDRFTAAQQSAPRGPTMIAGFTRRDLAHLFAALDFRSGAEIGVRQGAFSLTLCQAALDLQLIGVDPWRYYPTHPPQFSQDRHDENYRVARARLAPYFVSLLRMTSMEAVALVALESLDFVYIDGNHAYAYVVQDLDAWSARVRPGGIISGDDYDAPGVKLAVTEYAQAHGIDLVWLTDDPTRRNRKGQRFTSWFWVKP